MKRKICMVLILSLVLSTLLSTNLYAAQDFGWKEIKDYYILRENGELWFTNWWKCYGDDYPDSQEMFRVEDHVKSMEIAGDTNYVVKENGELWTITYKLVSKKPTFKIEKLMDGIAQAAVSSDNYYMVLKTNGELWGWGNNLLGQLGDGTTKYSSEPKKILDNVTQVKTANIRIYALKANGELWGWGNNLFGYLGDGTDAEVLVPKKILEDVHTFEVHGDATFAIKKNGELWGWGSNLGNAIYSDLVDGNNIAVRTVDKPMKLMDDVIKAGPNYAIKKNGDYYFWKSDVHPMLGLTGVKRISETNYRVVIKESGEVYSFTYQDTKSKILDGISYIFNSGAISKDGSFVSLQQQGKPSALLDSQQYVNVSGWALEGIKTADKNGLIEEAKNYPFNSTITREAFAKLSVSLYEKLTGNKEVVLKDNPFKDTADPDIIKAYSLGIIAGVNVSEFSPKGPIMREQIAAMLKRTLEAAKKEVAGGQKIAFKDMSYISSWALDSVNYMSSIGVINGSDNNFNPHAYTTVEQACIMLNRLYEKAK